MTENLVPKIEQRQEPWRRMAQQRWHLHASSSSLTRRRGTSSSPTRRRGTFSSPTVTTTVRASRCEDGDDHRSRAWIRLRQLRTRHPPLARRQLLHSEDSSYSSSTPMARLRLLESATSSFPDIGCRFLNKARCRFLDNVRCEETEAGRGGGDVALDSP
jgi:hypothetical protein